MLWDKFSEKDCMRCSLTCQADPPPPPPLLWLAENHFCIMKIFDYYNIYVLAVDDQNIMCIYSIYRHDKAGVFAFGSLKPDSLVVVIMQTICIYGAKLLVIDLYNVVLWYDLCISVWLQWVFSVTLLLVPTVHHNPGHTHGATLHLRVKNPCLTSIIKTWYSNYE